MVMTASAPLSPAIIAGSANPPLARAIEGEMGIRMAACTTERFPDGEVMARIDQSVRGLEVVLLQPTSPPVNDHLAELLALADACRRGAAERIVAVIPYFGYARSDRREGRRTAIMGRLVADAIERAGIAHVVVLDAHTPALEGFFRIPVDNLTAVPVLANALRPRIATGWVIVSPDLGATRLANHYATLLGLPVAICHKQRTSGTDVQVKRIIGDVAGRDCVIIDDMITTGATIAESVRALREAGAASSILVAATHAVLVPGALQKLAAAGVKELIVSDSIPAKPGDAAEPKITLVSVAPLVAMTMERLLAGVSLRELS
jgi:ribose-phosphate pyrophosphokinase